MSFLVSSAPKSPATPLRVLIVEDESLVALDLEERLAKLGYQIAGVVDNGAEALRHTAAAKVDLVLMDIHIRGDRDGIETAATLRESADIPVVFLTAHADEATLHRAGETEPFGYILKPFDERELRATIQMAHYRHRAESRLRKMERWLATTLRSIGDGVIATDSEGRIIFINAMAEAVSGWSRGEALGLPLWEVFVITTADGALDETWERLSRAMADGATIHLGEGRSLRTREGRLVPVDDSLAPIRDDGGAITGCVVIFRDNTANLAAEKSRRELEAKMQEAQRLESLGVLAAGIAHDFNNLLVAVTAGASHARTLTPAGSPLIPCLEGIEHAGERAGQLCHQMLAYAGKGQRALQALELSAFTRDTAQLLQASAHRNASFVMELAEGLPMFEGDPRQIQQVIMNLVINGSEALGEQGGTLTVRTAHVHVSRAFLSGCRVGADLGEGNYLLLEVTDTGHGMTPEVLARIFDPFFTTKFTGRGLGLAAISGIVRSHGGALAVESTPGKGTTFRVLFVPSAAAPAVVAPPPPDASWRGSGKALVVDDEISIRLVGGALLRHLGFEVETADDGRQGMEKATAEGSDFRVILLDLTMPKLDGHAVFQAIRAKRPAQPVLIMSGYSTKQAASHFQNGGPVAFIQKPFTLPDLVAKLQPLLSGSPSE